MFKDKKLWKDFEDSISAEKLIEKIEFILISKDNREINVSLSLSKREDKNGNFTGYFIAINDITERKSVETAILESEQKYKILAEASYDGIMTTDRKGIITYSSPALERMFAVPSSLSVGTHFSKYVTKKSALKGSKLFLELISGKIEFFENLEFVAIHKDGHTFPIEVTASALKEGGKTTHKVSIK